MTKQEQCVLMEKLTKSGESPQQLVIHHLEPMLNRLGIGWQAAEDLIRMAEVIAIATYNIAVKNTLAVIKGCGED